MRAALALAVSVLRSGRATGGRAADRDPARIETPCPPRVAIRETGPRVARTAGRWIRGSERLTCADMTLGSPARSGRVQAKSFIVTSLTNGRHRGCRRYARLQHQPSFDQKQLSLCRITRAPLCVCEYQALLGPRHSDVEQPAPL